MKALSFIFLATLLTCIGCAPIQPQSDRSASTPTISGVTARAAESNLTSGCVETYDPTVDYFPDKVTADYAVGWTVEYHNNYKMVTIPLPWNNATEQFQYLLLQCGTPSPDGYADVPVIEVPIARMITMSTTQLPHLLKLDRLDTLVGHESFQYVNTPEVQDLIDADKLVEVGSGAAVNVEQVLDTAPDLLLAYSLGNPERDAHPQLLDAGVPVVMSAEYMETTPLGRVEWLKFMALFLNEEEAANASFDATAQRYNEMATVANSVMERPTVFTGIPRGDSWYISGGRGYVAQFLHDAGAQYLWADDESTGSTPLAVEVVYDHVFAGDFWFNTSSWTALADVLVTDPRLAELAAYESGKIFNNNARVNANGGNDYWESGLANPDIILADLIKILHPELLPEHKLVYYQQLTPAE